jgi:hypothetical protein
MNGEIEVRVLRSKTPSRMMNEDEYIHAKCIGGRPEEKL